MNILRAVVAVLILVWFLFASWLLFAPLVTTSEKVATGKDLPLPPAAPKFEQPGWPKDLTAAQLLQRYTEQVKVYAQEAEAYGKYQDAYGKYAASLPKLGQPDRLSATGLGELVGKLLAALVAWAFVNAGAQVVNNAQLLRAGKPPEAIRLL